MIESLQNLYHVHSHFQLHLEALYSKLLICCHQIPLQRKVYCFSSPGNTSVQVLKCKGKYSTAVYHKTTSSPYFASQSNVSREKHRLSIHALYLNPSFACILSNPRSHGDSPTINLRRNQIQAGAQR